jgi:hypothetical protein
MKTKILTILFLTIALQLNAQVKLTTSNFFQVGYSTYTPLSLGSFYSEGVNNGKWFIESWDNGLNICRPWPNTNWGNYYLFIREDNGSVGIGKRPTLGKLDVAGDIYANGVKITSDGRLKTNVKKLSSCMVKLNKLNGKSYTKIIAEPNYTYKPEDIVDSIKYKTIQKNPNKREEVKEEFGFIAQELDSIFPELVQKDSLGYLSVDYISLIPVIVEALKEQKKTIDDQNTKIEQLEKLVKKGSGSKSTTVSNVTSTVIKSATLSQNAPNPFNQTTSIGYYLPETVNTATLYVYDMNGVQIKSIPITTKGEGKIIINGNELRPGMYLYTLIADGSEIDTKRMILTE